MMNMFIMINLFIPSSWLICSSVHHDKSVHPFIMINLFICSSWLICSSVPHDESVHLFIMMNLLIIRNLIICSSWWIYTLWLICLCVHQDEWICSSVYHDESAHLEKSFNHAESVHLVIMKHMVKFYEDAYWPKNLSLFTISCEHYRGPKK